tara:strand:+ start:594 stop:821 length:228 start_codon:yes stop_codon:yes gene_type:complete
MANNNNNNFKVGDEVWIEGKSLNQINKGVGCSPEEVKIIKITPKRFKVEWDCDGQREKPVIIYVKRVYKTYDLIN